MCDDVSWPDDWLHDSALAFAANAARASFLSRALAEATESDRRILSVDLEKENDSVWPKRWSHVPTGPYSHNDMKMVGIAWFEEDWKLEIC